MAEGEKLLLPHDDDEVEEEEDVAVVAVSSKSDHGGRRNGAAPAFVALPANGSSPRVVGGLSSAPASSTVASRTRSSCRVVTQSHKALTNGQTQPGAERASTCPSVVVGCKGESPWHHGSAASSPQRKRSRRDEDFLPSSSLLSSKSQSGRRGRPRRSLSRLPPSAESKKHKAMERKRREDARVALEQLREMVPALAGNKKATRASILQNARAYAILLTTESVCIYKEKERLEKHQQLLRQELAALQQQHRARHPLYRR
ncbi:uncharacterized protein LOC144108372 [Amblyomma americanum]